MTDLIEAVEAIRANPDDHKEFEEDYDFGWVDACNAVLELLHARALLAQPVAEGPTDDELLRLAREWNSGFESIELHFAADYARAVLAKWGRQ